MKDRLPQLTSQKPVPCLPITRGLSRYGIGDRPVRVLRVWATTRINLCKGPRNHQCDVILLFASAAELLDRPNHCLEKGYCWKVRMALEGVEQTRRAKFFPIRVLGLGDSIGVEHQRVTCSKLHFCNLALPGFKQSHHGAGGT